MAYYLGDTSQVERGAISLNPFKHIAWIGFLAFMILGLGWPKSMQVNPYHFKRGYLDLCGVALAGPLASLIFGLAGLLLTLGFAIVLAYFSDVSLEKVLPYLFRLDANLPQSFNVQALSIAFTGYLASASLWLTFISLLPLPGMDGFAAIFALVLYFRERHQKKTTPPALQSIPALTKQYQQRNKIAEIHFQAGAKFHQDQHYDDAIARYQQAIRNDQSFGPAYVNLGRAYLAKGDRKKAIQAFRAVTQWADDKSSQTEAWQLLHQLSETPPLYEVDQQKSMHLGTIPWTDTKAHPNWRKLGLGGILLLLSALGLYGYLITQLVRLLRA
jgi:tetratricopeptide (TPR) repeat protein